MTTVNSSVTTTLPSNVDDLVLTGTADINGTGNYLNNTITGNSGANVLDGSYGTDTLVGGAGNDTYVVDSAGDRVVENADEGIDTVLSNVSATLADNVENLTLTGYYNTNATGNRLDNVVTGDDASNVLNGLDGNDTLSGKFGDDTLDGGAGDDKLQGGYGDDTYIVDSAGDLVLEAAGAGTDTVRAGVTYALGENLEHLTLLGGADLGATGNTLNNTITGNGGANTIAAGAGADTVFAGNGNDTVFGGDGNDAVNGEAGDDDLSGELGNDTINGGLGADRMQGGAGDDSYVVDDAGDLVTEAAAEGKDLVNSSISYTLTGNVENLALTGTAATDGTGNSLDNTINGNAAANTLSGLDGNDTLNGNDGADRLFGDAGNDTLDGGAGIDYLQGDSGDDTYVVDNSADIVVELDGNGVDKVIAGANYTLVDNVENLTQSGGAAINGAGNGLDNVLSGNGADNVLSGLDGNDTLLGNGGNDTLDGGKGADDMQGGTGDDTYVVEQAGDKVTELAFSGTDTVRSSIDYTLGDNLDNLVLTGTLDLKGTGNALDNFMTGNAGDNTFAAGAGHDTVHAGEGKDIVDGGDGNDTVNAGGGNDTVTGGDGFDALNGDAGDDSLFGEAGNDTINGGLGADRMEGGSGDDTYILDDAGDLVIEATGEGSDLVNSSITYTLTDNVENLTLTGAANIDGTGNELNNVINGNTGANVLDGRAGNDTINGNSGADQLIGGEGNDLLNGDAGDDRLQGDSGNDVLNGGAGADNMAANTGDDTYVVDNAGDLVRENAGEGKDLVQSSINYTLTGNVENLTLTDYADINGSGNELDNVVTGNAANNSLFGLAGADTLVGMAGNDTLDGGIGADLMRGGVHDDTYIVDNAGDLVEELTGQGTDLVRSSIDYTLTANVDNLTLTGFDDLNGNGNELNNIITGNFGNNTINAGDGADTVNAFVGNDLVSGGNGDDTLNGDGGDDRLSGDAGNDSINGGTGADWMAGGLGDDSFVVDDNGDLVVEAAAEGTDLVNSSITYTLTDNVENLTLTGVANNDGTGNELANIITGNMGNNVLDGLAGNDLINAGMGNDTLLGGEGNDILNAGMGDDSLQGGEGNDSLNADMGDDTLLGGTGNDTLNGYTGLDLLEGGDGDDILNGEYDNDVLLGGSGNDRLNGGTGIDRMAGGSGDDSYVVDAVGDLVEESAAEGLDTVESSVSFTLGDNVEHLTLTGQWAIDGSGNGLDNVVSGNHNNNLLNGEAGNDTLVGNGGDDVLDGGSGADNLQGDSGNDTYVVDDAKDVVVEAAGAGSDTVRSSLGYVLGSNLENLVLTGSEHLTGTGNTLANSITGNAGNNLIDGGAGVDTMSGGAGDDTYIVDATGDVINEAANAGKDIAYASASYTLSAHIEELVLTGTAAINGTGNAQDNIITGNGASNVLSGMAGKDLLLGGEGNDTLDGGAGIDTMVGSTGNDTYVVDDALDTVVESAGEGIDTLQTTLSTTLGANLENLTLLGSAHLSATGNEVDNVIIGNSGNNLLDGAGGKDTLAGGDGNDTYLVDVADTVVEAAGGGTDTVRSDFSYTLGANIENLVLLGDGDLNGTGNALANAILGTDGANILDGGAGADTLDGGAGDDTYIVDSAADLVVEAAGEGTDTVYASSTYQLSANVENLVMTATTGSIGTGNAGDNSITGNSGNDILDGGAGADHVAGGGGNDMLFGADGDDTLDGGTGGDMLLGGAGNDSYLVDDTGDTVHEFDSTGSDTVYASVNHVLGANVEHLVLTGSASMTGAGNALDNTITGNGGDNQLSGMDGDDLLAGGAGNDVLLGGAGKDTYVFGAGDGADRVIDAQGEGMLKISGGLSAADLHAEESGRDLVLTIVATGDSVVLVDWLVQGEGVTGIVFDDGSTLDRGGMEALLNVAPTAIGDSVDVLEDGGVLQVPVTSLLANDTDADVGDVLSVIAVGASGIGATVSLDGGIVGYDIGAGFQHLAQGEIVNDSFSYTISDEMGETSTATVAVQLIGTNDAAVTVADAGAVVEDSAPGVSGNVLANDSDVDHGTVLQVAAPGTIAGTYGTLTIARDGSYSYSLNAGAANVQALGEGHVATDSFAYTATDGIEGVASTLDITITGTNDGPLLAADSVQVAEDAAAPAGGNLLANDSDVDAGTTLVVTAATSQGQYGVLSVQADGSYAYSLDAASVQSFGRTASATEHFVYGATDGIEAGSAALEVTVAGTNDAPIVVAPLADHNLTFNKAFSFQLPGDSFTDIDQGDTLTYAATLADGSALPGWLKFDAASGTFTGTTPRQVGSIEVRVTATDQVGATGSTEGSLSASDVFTLTVSHGNEGLGNGEDAAPSGHDTNQNDGPGTSPGNPGSKLAKQAGIPAGTTAAAGVPVVPAAETSGALAVPAYVSVSNMVEFSAPASSIGNTTSAQSFGAWLKVDLAVSEALADKKSLSWLDERSGADTSALAQATAGFLGSTATFSGGASFSKIAEVELKGFEGLGKGAKKLK